MPNILMHSFVIIILRNLLKLFRNLNLVYRKITRDIVNNPETESMYNVHCIQYTVLSITYVKCEM